MTTRARRMLAVIAGTALLLARLAGSTAADPDRAIRLRADRVAYAPGQQIVVTIDAGAGPALRGRLTVTDNLGAVVDSRTLDNLDSAARVSFAGVRDFGGYQIVGVFKEPGGRFLRAVESFSAPRTAADDLRYGFYTDWARMGSDYARKAEMLAEMHINAVEYYDWCPAHGSYAPSAETYSFEPVIGTEKHIILGDIRAKIDSARDRGILSLAYVSAYAASPSVYARHPYALTNALGDAKAFAWRAAKSEAQPSWESSLGPGDAVWFRYMAIADDSPWFPYIMDQFYHGVADDPDHDSVAFDGYELDSYGDDPNQKYYTAASSVHDGTRLLDRIHDLVKATANQTHHIRPRTLVSFNSVDEYAIKEMYDVDDFIFTEIWPWHGGKYTDLAKIAYGNRGAENKRVVMKVYPRHHGDELSAWSDAQIALINAAIMAGGGSWMTLGEPDEASGTMRYLRHPYYPSHGDLSESGWRLFHDFNDLDARLYGLTHGQRVSNLECGAWMDGAVAHAFLSDHGTISVTLLNVDANEKWIDEATDPPPIMNGALEFSVPAGYRATAAYWDAPGPSAGPREVPFTAADGKARVSVPELDVFGVATVKVEADGGR